GSVIDAKACGSGSPALRSVAARARITPVGIALGPGATALEGEAERLEGGEGLAVVMRAGALVLDHAVPREPEGLEHAQHAPDVVRPRGPGCSSDSGRRGRRTGARAVRGVPGLRC